jgi:DDB1- and CUL4-associated factor 6
MDLNSISCAASQPQYIALGGAHLHCFLHDRRMLGRDLDAERGLPGVRDPAAGTNEDDIMAEATRCVRRFAPNNKRAPRPREHPHITACKISDANPNELVASWSGDHIYSFDIVKSPDARDADAAADFQYHARRLRNRSDRKRKRVKPNASSSSLGDAANPSQRLRRVADQQQENGQTAMLPAFVSGASAIRSPSSDGAGAESPTIHEVLLSEAERSSERVARALIQLRKTLFDFSASLGADVPSSDATSDELTPHEPALTSALGQCAALLPQMDEIIRAWAYPVNPTEEDVSLQNTLRRNRQASWRFVQAAGCLSVALGGRLQTPSSGSPARLPYFGQITPASHEGKNIGKDSQFCYDFLKAILLWLEGGKEAVLHGFRRPPNVSAESPRFPLGQEGQPELLVPRLEAYLLQLADNEKEKPILDLDTNRFERDEVRQIFGSQKAAVLAFTRALTHIELRPQQGLSDARIDPANPDVTFRVMDKGAAARFWGVKVGRSLLMSAAQGVTFDFVNRAFGGLRLQSSDSETEADSEAGIDVDSEEQVVVEGLDIAAALGLATASEDTALIRDTVEQEPRAESQVRAAPIVAAQGGEENSTADVADEDEDTQDDNAHDESEEEATDSDDSDDSDEEDPYQFPTRRRPGWVHLRNRVKINSHVAYSSHSRVYKGHANSRTVKDVNYYGLNDEYVVSGSDDGYFFIWDKKTSKILNILEGDGEIVNVVQGHPYEPMIACSGIDSTVKIFGPAGESRERHAAEKGVDIANPGGTVHSSLRFGGRRNARHRGNGEAEDGDDDDGDEAASRGLKSRRAMHRSYEITSQNDVGRRRNADEIGYGTVSSMEELLARAWIMSTLRMI